MPLSDRLQVMESRLHEIVPGADFGLRSGDLFSVTKAEREALLDDMVSGGTFPFVFVDGVVVHSGDLSVEPVAAALRTTKE